MMHCKKCGLEIGISTFGLCSPCVEKACHQYRTATAPDLREAEIADLKAQLAEAKGDLKANAAMLAKQHDLNRQIETALATANKKLEGLAEAGRALVNDWHYSEQYKNGEEWQLMENLEQAIAPAQPDK